MNKKYLIISILLSIVFVTLFHSSVSPLYNHYYTIYGNHDSATALLMNRNILDLFSYHLPYGPLYYAITYVGQFISLYLFEIIVMTVCIYMMLIHMHKPYILAVLIIPYIACISTGLLPGFYITVFTLLGYHCLDHKYGSIILGFLTLCGFLIDPFQASLLYGLCLYQFIRSVNKDRCILMSFVCIIVGIIVMNSSMMMTYFHVDISSTVIIHKIIKILPVLLIGILSIYSKKDRLLISILCFMYIVFAFMNPIDWHYYMTTTVFVYIMLKDYEINMKTSFILISTCAVFAVPMKNYISYLINSDFTTAKDLVTSINEYYENIEDRNLLLVSMPSYYYLETNTYSDCAYMTKQTNVYDEAIYNYMEDYYNHGEAPLMIARQRGFFSQEYGNYVLVDMVIDDRTTYAIYEKLEEGEHTHETHE